MGGSDYTPISQELVFADGDTAMTLSVSVLDDSDPEPLERFRVFLSAPLGGAAIIDTAAVSPVECCFATQIRPQLLYTHSLMFQSCI